MPKKIQFSRGRIVEAVIDIIRKEGHEALSARSICKALGCSVTPLFTAYNNMDEILADTRKEAEMLFSRYVGDVLEYKPAFKEFGMRFVRLAKEDPNFFYYLFLDKESSSYVADTKALECLERTRVEFGLTPDEAMRVFRFIWPFTFGLATLANREPDHFSDATLSDMLSSQFMSQMMLVKSGRKVMNINPHLCNEGDTIVLRRWLDSDSRDLFEFASDERVSPPAGWSLHDSEEQSLSIIRNVLKRDGIWAIQLKESGKVIGSIGYKTAKDSTLDLAEDEVEIGIGIARPYWDQGICSEALHILIDYCMRVKSFKALWAVSFVDNPASGRALEKCGFMFTGTEISSRDMLSDQQKTGRLMKLERR